jgi:hypothetical protein
VARRFFFVAEGVALEAGGAMRRTSVGEGEEEWHPPLVWKSLVRQQ